MRRALILGLTGLLIFVIVLDFQSTTETPRTVPLYITVTSGPRATDVPSITPVPPTALPTATLNPTVEAVALTLTQMDVDATASAPPLPQPLTYTIQSGDTPFNLSERYGVSIEAILRANNITDPTRLRVGQVVSIPVGIPLELVQPAPTSTVPAAVVAAASYLTATPTRIAFEVGNITPVFGPPPQSVNGIAFDSVVVMPEGVRQHVREIYAQGHALGNNPQAFSKLGDSTIEHPYFLGRFDDGPYNLGQYNYLKPVIDYFSGSFRRESVAVKRGLHTWSVLDPMWATDPQCLPGEHMLTCEFRLNRPSVLFIRLGTNDTGIPESTDKSLREIVDFALANGVIPVLGTKADRFEGPGNINNDIMRRIAADYQVPLWDFDLMAQTLPGRGLDQDGVHLTTFFAHDYTRPEALQRGYGIYNLTALMMLDMIWREMYETKF